jgi:hypothetical protein
MMVIRRVFFGCVLLCIALVSIGAQQNESFDLQVLGKSEADNFGLYWGGQVIFEMDSDLFSARGDLRFVNDGKWNATEGWMPEGYYFDLREGSLLLGPGPLYFEGGLLRATHQYSQNPFEIILDAEGKPGIGMSLLYEGDLLTYQTRWIGLNYKSPFAYDYVSEFQTWIDRGLSHKIYMLNFGDLRIGYQESSLFLDRYFDTNFFLNPAPSILINTIWSQGNNPWVYDVNDSSFMGFYGDYQADEFRLEGEFMLKDINLPFGYPENLNKFGWSLGGTWFSPWGDLSFWHGGATKHLYAATYSDATYSNTLPYEYTYYPVSTLGDLTIALEDSYIGFPFGENSLAFQLAWEDRLTIQGLEIDGGARLNYVISGSKSPHNPWHEDQKWTDIDAKTELFSGDPVLEHQLGIEVAGSTQIGNIVLRLELGLGFIANPLALNPVTDEAGIWKPQAGRVVNDSHLDVTIGYRVQIRDEQ